MCRVSGSNGAGSAFEPFHQAHREQHAEYHERGSHEAGVAHSGTVVDRKSSAVCADRVSEVEGYLYHRASHHLAALGMLDDKVLLGRGHGEQPSAAQAHRHRGYELARGSEEEAYECRQHYHLRRRYDPRRGEAVGEAASEVVAHAHASSCKHHHQRHRRRLETCDIRHERAHIAVVAEYSAVAGHGDGKYEPGLLLAQEPELSLNPVVGKGGEHRNPPVYEEYRERAPEGGECEDHPPAHRLAQEGSDRDSEQIGDGHAHDHDRHGGGAFAFRCELLCDYASHSEERAVGQSGNQPRAHRYPEAGGEGRDEAAYELQGYQSHEYAPERSAARDENREGSAYAYSQRVCRDEMSRLGNRYAEVGCYVGEDSHHHVFCDAEPECAECEGIQALVSASCIHLYFFY